MTWNNMRGGGLPLPADRIDEQFWINSPRINAPPSPIDGPADVRGGEREVLGMFIDYLQSRTGIHPLRNFTYNLISRNNYSNAEFKMTYERALNFAGALIAMGETTSIRAAAEIAAPKVIDIFTIWVATQYPELQDPDLEHVAAKLMQEGDEIKALVADYLRSSGRGNGGGWAQGGIGTTDRGRSSWGGGSNRQTESGDHWGPALASRNRSKLGGDTDVFRPKGSRGFNADEAFKSDTGGSSGDSVLDIAARRNYHGGHTPTTQPVEQPQKVKQFENNSFEMALDVRQDKFGNKVVVEAHPDYPIKRDWTEEQPLPYLYDPEFAVLTYAQRPKDNKIVELIYLKKEGNDPMASVAQHSLALAKVADVEMLDPRRPVSKTMTIRNEVVVREPETPTYVFNINHVEGSHFISAATTSAAIRSAVTAAADLVETSATEVLMYTTKKVYVIPSVVDIGPFMLEIQNTESVKTLERIFDMLSIHSMSKEACEAIDNILSTLVNETLSRDFMHKAKLTSFMTGVVEMCEILENRFSKTHLQQIEQAVFMKLRNYLRVVPDEEAMENYKGLLVMPDVLHTTVIERITSVLAVPFTAEELNLYGESSTGMVSKESATVIYGMLEEAFHDIPHGKQMVTCDGVAVDVERSTVNENCWRITLA